MNKNILHIFYTYSFYVEIFEFELIGKQKGSRKKTCFFSGPATKRGGLTTKKKELFLKL